MRETGTPEELSRRADQFAELAALAPPEREHRLAALPEAEQNELRELLRFDDPEGADLAAAVWEMVEDWSGEVQYAGRYRLEELLGRGGMGAVYRATAEEDGVTREAAVKLLTALPFDTEFERQFERERHTLARLSHPYIAGLIESGRTEAGQPFLAMEYVRGVRIDEHAAVLGLRQKVELFRKVCDAVSAAHRSLIIHRDLKPSNVLITPDGLPKLLDFGIARPADLAEQTRTGPAVMTIEYASPEQVRGEPQTVATDIYSLGAVLYRLLAGRVPFAADSPLELARKVVEETPVLPAVPADLQAIIAKALRKEPERRYETVAALADDLARWLAGKPVAAQPDTWRYRASRFLRRNWAASAAAAVALLAVLGGAGAAWWQAREAQRRFNEVRKLANTALFDFEESIRDIPGTTNARKLILDTSLEYLESLSRAAARDDSLRRELADAYQKVAALQMSGSGQNLENVDAALRSLEAALAIREQLGDGRSKDTAIRERYCALLTRLTGLSRVRMKIPQSEAYGDRAKAAVDGWVRAEPESPRALLSAVYVYDEFARRARRKQGFQKAIEAQQETVALVERLARVAPKDRETLKVIADQQRLLGALLGEAERVEEGRAAYRESREAARALLAQYPSITAQRTLLYTLHECASFEAKLNGPLDEAEAYLREAETILDAGFRADPGNQGWWQHRINNWITSGRIAFERGQVREGTERIERAMAKIDELLAASPRTMWAAVERARATQLLANPAQYRRR